MVNFCVALAYLLSWPYLVLPSHGPGMTVRMAVLQAAGVLAGAAIHGIPCKPCQLGSQAVEPATGSPPTWPLLP